MTPLIEELAARVENGQIRLSRLPPGETRDQVAARLEKDRGDLQRWLDVEELERNSRANSAEPLPWDLRRKEL